MAPAPYFGRRGRERVKTNKTGLYKVSLFPRQGEGKRREER
jgi:hypothetical protein